MKYYIEHFERLRGKAWGWVRVDGAGSTTMQTAEEMKRALAKSEAEPVENYAILVCVEDNEYEVRDVLMEITRGPLRERRER